MRLHAGCMTCKGNVREENQDAVVLRIREEKKQYFCILAVCDGIGGLESGEIASEIARKTVSEWFDFISGWMDFDSMDEVVLYAHLKDLAEECNARVREYQSEKKICTGSTMSLLMIFKKKYYIIQVGDSRVYRYNGGMLEQLTRDASVTKLKNGMLKKYLDNYLGKQEELWFSEQAGTVEKEDIFLVCSDGFYNNLLEADIAELEKEAGKPKQIDHVCEQLIERMLARGEKDNITIGMVVIKDV